MPGMEVYTGTKPGRPARLLITSAGVFVGALALAWIQIHQARALSAPVRIPGTPLLVRAPLNWVQNRDDPSVFDLPARVGLWRRDEEQAERRIRFRYQRLPVFQAPVELLRDIGWLKSPEGPPEPARIGAFEAIQARRVVSLFFRGQRFE